MSMDAISDKLRDIFVAELGMDYSDIDHTLRYNAIPEWDSVGHMHLVAAIEESFAVEVSDNDVAEMTTFTKVVETVARLVGRG